MIFPNLSYFRECGKLISFSIDQFLQQSMIYSDNCIENNLENAIFISNDHFKVRIKHDHIATCWCLYARNMATDGKETQKGLNQDRVYETLIAVSSML